MPSCQDKYTTLLDLARQAKIISGNTACFDGKIQVGIPFSGYPTGVDLTTIVNLGVISQEDAVFSSSTATTIFDVANSASTTYNPIFDPYSEDTWTNPLFSANTVSLNLPITSFSADTQTVGPFWTLTQTGMTGDNVIGTQYTGYTIQYGFFSVTPIFEDYYTGFTTAQQITYSAGTLDYKGPLDYLHSREDATVENRLTTKKLKVTGGASASTIGYVLTQIDEEGNADWVYNSPESGSTITAFDYNNNNTFTITDGEGNTFSATINEMSGLTINGDLTVTGDTQLDGDLIVEGQTTLRGQTTIGNSFGDSVDIVARVNADIVPVFDDNVSLGSNVRFWKNLYVHNITGGTLNLYSGLTTNNSGTEILVRNTATGQIEKRDVSTIGVDTMYWTSGSSGNYSIKTINDSGLDSTGDYSAAGGYNTNTNGDTSFIYSKNSTTNSDNSVILGGTDSLINTGSTNSGIFVGSGNTIGNNFHDSVIIGGDDNSIEIVDGTPCGCPCGFYYDPIASKCVSYEDSLSPSTGYVVGGIIANAAFSAYGARFCTPNSYTDCWEPGAGGQMGTNYFRINQFFTAEDKALQFFGTGSTTTGRLNEIGVWGVGLPNNEWLGFSRCFTLPSDGQYLFALAGDNQIRATVDGEVIVENPYNGSTTDVNNFRTWWVWPIDFIAGQHNIILEGKNNSGAAGFGCEIIGPFPSDTFVNPIDFNIFTGQTGVDVYTANTVFSSSEAIGDEYDTSEDMCPEGYSYDACTESCIKGIACSDEISPNAIVGGCSHSIIDSSQYGGILGGCHNTLEETQGSVILGGRNISGSTNDTAYVPNLNINYQPDQDDNLTQMLVRDTDGTVKYRNIDSISNSYFVTGGTSTIKGLKDIIGNHDLSGSTDYGFIAGGNNNTIDNTIDAAIIGGDYGEISGSSPSYPNTSQGSTILGGLGAGPNRKYILESAASSIMGGFRCFIEYSDWSSIIGVQGGIIKNNFRDISSPPTSQRNFLGGGSDNLIDGGSADSIIGGNSNSILYNSLYSGFSQSNFIGGGNNNTIDGHGSSVILGGQENTVEFDIISNNAIIAGYGNTITGGGFDGIFAGSGNTIQGVVFWTQDDSNTIIGGRDNTVYSGVSSSIVGGQRNHLENLTDTLIENSVILGGSNLTGTSNNTVYVPNLNINNLGDSDAIYGLGVDSDGYVVSGNTGFSSDSCLSDFYVTNVHSCSPLNINPLDEGNIIFGSNDAVTIDIFNKRIVFREGSKIKEQEIDGKQTVVIGAGAEDVILIDEDLTKVQKGDFKTENGDVIVKSGNSKTLIIEDLDNIGGANLGTDMDGKLIDIPSDSRVKQNIKQLPTVVDPLEFLSNIKGYQFEWKEHSRIGPEGKKYYGFKVDDFRDNLISDPIGQTHLTPAQVTCNNIAKSMVRKSKTKFKTSASTHKEEMDTMNYIDLVPFMIEGIKSLNQSVVSLNSHNSSGSKKHVVTTQLDKDKDNVITHNFNEEDVIVQLRDSETGDMIIPKKVFDYQLNTVKIQISETKNYKIIILG